MKVVDAVIPAAYSAVAKYDFVWVNKNLLAPNGIQPQVNDKRIYDVYHRGIKGVFREMKDLLSKGVEIECESWCSGDKLAYVWMWSERIHICPDFWGLGAEQKKLTLIHELSHAAAGTGDDKLSWKNKRGDITDAADDAYWVEELAGTDSKNAAYNVLIYTKAEIMNLAFPGLKNANITVGDLKKLAGGE